MKGVIRQGDLSLEERTAIQDFLDEGGVMDECTEVLSTDQFIQNLKNRISRREERQK